MAHTFWILALVVVVVTVLQQVVHALPSDDTVTSTPHTEDAKVAKLRQKLQRLHKILYDFEKSDDLMKLNPTEKPVNLQPNDMPNHQDVNDASKQQENKHQQKERDLPQPNTVPAHLKSRAIKFEDMQGTFERDTDEDALKQLSGKDEDEYVQILAKALAQLSGKTKQSHGSHKGTRHESDVTKKRLTNNDPDMESSIMAALASLTQRREGRGEDRGRVVEKENPFPLFHAAGSNQKTKHLSGNTKTKTYANDDRAASHDLGDNGSDNAGYDDDNKVYGDLLQASIDSGLFKPVEENITTKINKSKVLKEIETNLMDNIDAANQLGVSVDDLIQDLEDKAFKEAMLRRIQRLLDPR